MMEANAVIGKKKVYLQHHEDKIKFLEFLLNLNVGTNMQLMVTSKHIMTNWYNVMESTGQQKDHNYQYKHCNYWLVMRFNSFRYCRHNNYFL